MDQLAQTVQDILDSRSVGPREHDELTSALAFYLAREVMVTLHVDATPACGNIAALLPMKAAALLPPGDYELVLK